jgi:hypothetical protein
MDIVCVALVSEASTIFDVYVVALCHMHVKRGWILWSIRGAADVTLLIF